MQGQPIYPGLKIMPALVLHNDLVSAYYHLYRTVNLDAFGAGATPVEHRAEPLPADASRSDQSHCGSHSGNNLYQGMDLFHPVQDRSLENRPGKGQEARREQKKEEESQEEKRNHQDDQSGSGSISG